MLKRLAILTIVFVGYFVLFARNALAFDYFVSPSGSDLNTGSLESPWRSIQKAVDTVRAGDTVQVRAGTYSGRVNLKYSGTVQKPIVIQGYQDERPHLSGGSWVGITNYGQGGISYVTIKGFEVSGFEQGIYILDSSHINLINNKVHSNSQFGIDVSRSSNISIFGNEVYETSGFSGIWGNEITNSKIYKNSTHDNNHNGIGISHGSDNNEIYQNIAYGNSCNDDQRYAGIAIEVDSENNLVVNNLMYKNCHAGFVSNSPNNEYYFNTFYGNYENSGNAAQVLLGDWSGSSPHNNIFKNNIFVSTRSNDHAVGMGIWDGVNYDPYSNTFDNNLYFNTASTNPVFINVYVNGSAQYTFSQWQNRGKELQGLHDDPQLVDPSNNNYHLQPSSPAIDMGSNVLLSTDMDGVFRPQGQGFDIGAYEYGGSVVPTNPPTPTPTTPPIPSADANGDSLVDGIDYTIWLKNFDLNVFGPTSGDFDYSLKVDNSDFLFWLEVYFSQVFNLR